MATKKSDSARLEEIRNQIASLKDEAAELDTRPVDRETAMAALDRWIEEQAASFDPPVSNLIKSGEAFTQLHQVRMGGTWDFTPALCALAPDAIRDWFGKRITRELNKSDPTPPDQVAARKREIDGERLALEREEEQIVQRMQQRGEEVQRRGDADVRAILGLDRAPERPAPSEAAQEDKPKVALGEAQRPWGQKL